MVKGWVHPITQAKMNIFGNPNDAKKVMLSHGLGDDALPKWLGGTCEGTPTFEYLKSTVAKNSQAQQQAATAASAAACSAAAESDRVGKMATV